MFTLQLLSEETAEMKQSNFENTMHVLIISKHEFYLKCFPKGLSKGQLISWQTFTNVLAGQAELGPMAERYVCVINT